MLLRSLESCDISKMLSLKELKNRVKLHRDVDFELERRNEVKLFLNITDDSIENLSKGKPFGSFEYKKYLHRFFSAKKMETDQGVFDCYSRAAEKYLLRHMLGRLDKIDMMYPIFIELQNYMKSKNTVIVYDYGFGVGDIVIAMNKFGFEVHGCELQNKLLDFARWRFQKRGIRVRIDTLHPPKLYPDLPKNTYDVVICREILEHIRNPLKVIRLIHGSLEKDGILYTSSLYPGSTREAGGTHLRESILEACSEQYIDTFNRLFKTYGLIPGLYRKQKEL